MAARDDLYDFFREAAFFRCHPKFQAFERDYKIRFAHGLSECQRLLDSDRDRALQSLIDALKSPDNNIIINWRQNAQLLDWIRESPKRVATVLSNFWRADHGTAGSWEAFCGELSKIGIEQSGAQLTVGSTLLMALSPEDNPPIRTTPITNAMKQFDWAPLRSIVDVGAKYLAAIQFLDELRRQASLHNIHLRDRLDAQSVLWWCTVINGGKCRHLGATMQMHVMLQSNHRLKLPSPNSKPNMRLDSSQTPNTKLWSKRDVVRENFARSLSFIGADVL